MSEQVQKYAEEFPRLIRQAVDGLSGDNKVSYAVVALLAEGDELQFSEIRNELNVHPQTLSDSLESLEKGGIVNKMAGSKIGDKSTGAYVITDFGDRFLDSLFGSLSQRNSRERSASLTITPLELPDGINSKIEESMESDSEMPSEMERNSDVNVGMSDNVEILGDEPDIVASGETNITSTVSDSESPSDMVPEPTGRHTNTPEEEMAK